MGSRPQYGILMIESGGCENVILLAGDTVSKCVNPKDRAVAPLFGDAGSATLVTRSPMNSWFSLNTNGKGCGFIQIPGGAFRHPSSDETKKESADEDGNIRSLENLYMNGAEVFNFSIKEEPAAIREILEFSGKSIEEIDWIVFHQANKYIIGNIARRLKVPLEKVPCGTVAKYGNQSSASIPSAICSEISQQVRGGVQRMNFSGFDVGLSWASCVIETPPIFVIWNKSGLVVLF
jgi:3-oxoacyl-[acyl-carrier-protein] synthase-3